MGGGRGVHAIADHRATDGGQPGVSGESSTITLRAREGEPLDNEQVRATVTATAEAIAERQGVPVLEVSTTPSSITVTLQTGRIQAIGFAAELRTLTTNWYKHKYGFDHLWGSVDKHDAGEEWKA